MAKLRRSCGSVLRSGELALASEPKEGPGEFWLVLVSHGTFDGKEARFDLRGPDLSATELATHLQPFGRPVAVVDTTSASASFLSKLSASNRADVTATRSGFRAPRVAWRSGLRRSEGG